MAFRWNQIAVGKHRISFMLVFAALFAGSLLANGMIMQPLDPGKQMQLTSTAFKNMQPIPRDYTCDGKNISPPLSWKNTPAGTGSFVLIVDDPDAPGGTWTHWVVYNLPADTSDLAEDAARSQFTSGETKEGSNDFKHVGYGGPCPPAGNTHRYMFKLYALDAMLGLKAGASKKEVEAAMAKHILGQGQLIGTYQRQ
jgi:Raf kinase inhibitor-like YbhB/YbcL family protein